MLYSYLVTQKIYFLFKNLEKRVLTFLSVKNLILFLIQSRFFLKLKMDLKMVCVENFSLF